MELNEINSANMTDRIVESISRTNDGSVHEENSALNEHIQREDREENDEGDYEEYRFRYQEYGQEPSSANTRNDRSIDETILKRCQECDQEIEETEELYEECIYEGDYEKYRFRCQECGQERKSVNTRNGRSIDETLFQKLLKSKWWLLCMILVLVIVGTVVGLSIHFIEPITVEPITTEPITIDSIRSIEQISRIEPITIEPITTAVLILSTWKSNNVPMVITSTGESQRVSALPVSIG